MNKLSDEELDDLLRRDFAGAVADDGFTARVVHEIAPAQWHRPWLPVVAVLAGSLLAWLALLPSGLWLHVTGEWLSGGVGASSAVMCTVSLGIGVLGCMWALEEPG